MFIQYPENIESFSPAGQWFVLTVMGFHFLWAIFCLWWLLVEFRRPW